jgi:hypothetical protein
MEKLKPCPFCGSSDMVILDDGYSWIVDCASETCPASPQTLGATRDDALAAWNTRSEPVPTIPLSRLDEWVDDFNRQMLEDPWAFDHEVDQENMIAWISDLIDLLNEENKP